MANDFGALTDHWGLASADLKLIESSDAPRVENVGTAEDENGDLAARTTFGNDGGTIRDVSCKYQLVSGTLNLNTLSLGEQSTGVVIVDISAGTNNKDWPEITVAGVLGTPALQAPSGKTATAALPSLTLTGGRFAQLLSFTVGEGCKLNASSFKASAELGSVEDGLGEPAAFGIAFNDPPEITASFVRITAQPSWTPTGNLEETQAPTTVEPQAAYHTSEAAGVLAPLVRGTGA